MIVHIVRPNETIELIAKAYNLSVNEIISINPHFRSWEHLAPGAKLRIPEIPEYIQDEIDEVDPFIEDYYPKINIDEIINKIPNEVKLEEQETKKENKDIKKNYSIKNPYYYYPYYGMYNYYPYSRKR